MRCAEGTGSYGAGLTRHLRGQGISVVEVNRPDRRQRSTYGKSDLLDAYAAADAVLAGRARALLKSGDGTAEAIRALHVGRAGGDRQAKRVLHLIAFTRMAHCPRTKTYL